MHTARDRVLPASQPPLRLGSSTCYGAGKDAFSTSHLRTMQTVVNLGLRNSLPYSASEIYSKRLLLSTLSARLESAERATWRRWPFSIPLLSLSLVRAQAAWRPWARPGNCLTQVVKRASRLGRSQQWLIGVPGNECGPASAPPAEPDVLNRSRGWHLPGSFQHTHLPPGTGVPCWEVTKLASSMPASTLLLTEPLSAQLCSLPLCQGAPYLSVLRPQRLGVSAQSTGFGV